MATEVAGLIESRLKYQHSDNCKPKLIIFWQKWGNKQRHKPLPVAEPHRKINGRERTIKTVSDIMLEEVQNFYR